MSDIHFAILVGWVVGWYLFCDLWDSFKTIINPKIQIDGGLQFLIWVAVTIAMIIHFHK